MEDDERVMKISPQGVTRYITDGNGQVLAEYDGYNNLQYEYIFGNVQKLAGIDASGAREYYHNDYLGSVRRVSNSTGTVTWSRDYYPFGETREAGGANEDNHYTYEGKEKDLETDLWYNTARYFNDEGRFTQIDPLWSKYPSLSPYVRVANNPLRFVDEDGRVVETAVDATSFAQGVYAISQWDDNTSISDKVMDVGGVILDGISVGIPFLPGGFSLGLKVLRTGDKAIDGVKIVDKASDVSKIERVKNINKGIPESKLGPSGKPKIHKVKHTTKKQAKDAARDAGTGKPVKHVSPKKGDPHYHSVDNRGNKKRIHHEYPKE